MHPRHLPLYETRTSTRDHLTSSTRLRILNTLISIVLQLGMSYYCQIVNYYLVRHMGLVTPTLREFEFASYVYQSETYLKLWDNIVLHLSDLVYDSNTVALYLSGSTNHGGPTLKPCSHATYSTAYNDLHSYPIVTVDNVWTGIC